MKRRNSFFVLTSMLLLMATWGCCFAQTKQHHINLVNSAYSVVYDPVQGIPLRVSWRLRPSDFAVTRKRVTKNFKQDGRCPKPRIKDADYRNTGYMRGHLCPAADRTQTKAMMKETFLMSNVAPSHFSILSLCPNLEPARQDLPANQETTHCCLRDPGCQGKDL